MTNEQKIKDLESKIEQLKKTIEGYRMLSEKNDEIIEIYKQLNALK